MSILLFFGLLTLLILTIPKVTLRIGFKRFTRYPSEIWIIVRTNICLLENNTAFVLITSEHFKVSIYIYFIPDSFYSTAERLAGRHDSILISGMLLLFFDYTVLSISTFPW